MTNKEIYKRTLGFSIRRLFFDFISIILFVGCSAAGYLLLDKLTDKGLIGLAIGAVIGIIIIALISRFVSYTMKAGQIAMMTRGVTEGELPDNVIAEGKRAVKERFKTVAVFFALTGAIKAIFNQLGRGLTKLGSSIGGDTGGAVGSTVSTAINTLVSYLCDCCLGWVFYRKDQSAVRATCEGAALFFKHGKTLFKNMGRIFGMGLLSLLLIGGAFTGVFYLIFSGMPNVFTPLAAEIAEAAARSETNISEFFTDPATLPIVCAALLAIVLWSIIHSAFVRPFILTGVLRNYIESGMKAIPSEASFASLKDKSPRFAKLCAKLDD